MFTIILAGGKGSRLGSTTKKIPKPMVKIGKDPILLHIMRIYQKYNYNNFIICTGYLHDKINKFFNQRSTSKKIILCNKKKYLEYSSKKEGWKVILNFTGLNSMTGERIKRSKNLINYYGLEDFLLTYGDGVGSINIKKLVSSHRRSKKIATITAVKPPPRFGALTIKNRNVINFSEKKMRDNVWINGGFFVLNKKIFNFIKGKNPIWEQKPLEKLAKHLCLNAYKHSNFWQPMDTIKDKNQLTELFYKHNNLLNIK